VVFRVLTPNYNTPTELALSEQLIPTHSRGKEDERTPDDDLVVDVYRSGCC
jgi:hypothetical protein